MAEWREVRTVTGSSAQGSRVDRAVAVVRRWELETEMLREFHLTLPPETTPLDDERRGEQIRRGRTHCGRQGGSWDGPGELGC